MATGMSAAIEAVWLKSRAETERRIATLEHAVAAMLAGQLAPELRDRARGDAHKLAGSLGMFGLKTGSLLAREVEQMLATCIPHDLPRSAELVRALRDEVDARRAGGSTVDDAEGGALEQVAGREPAVAARPAHGGRTILVIDDSALIRRVVALGLGGDRGWRVHAAESGAQGLELAASERPDAILLDVNMPGLDGPQTLARLRAGEATREIPVLFVTAHCTAEDRRRLEALGAAGVIAKPFDPAKLAAEVVRLLEWEV